MMKRLLLWLPVLMLMPSGAWADALISGWGIVATKPLLSGSAIPIDQSGTTDAHWVNPSAADIGGALTANNLSDMVAPATARSNIGAAPVNNPTFTGAVTVPALAQSATGSISATADFVKAQELYAEASWINRDINNTCIHIAHQAEKVTGITGRVTVAAGAGSTMSIVKVPSGIAVASGVALTTTPTPNLLADSSLNTNQTLTLVTTTGTLNLTVGDGICVTTNGGVTGNFTTSDGVITVSYVKQ